MTPPSLLSRIFLTPDEHRLRSGWRVILQFILWNILSLVFFPVAGWILSATQNGSNGGLVLADGALTVLATTAAVYIARRWLDRRSFSSLGLAWNARSGRDLLFGFLLSGLLMGLIFLAEWAAGWLTFEGFAWQTESLSQLISGLLIVLVGFVFVGWSEELLFRGYQLQNLAEGLNLFWGVTLSSIIFALLHLLNPNATWIAVLGLIGAGYFMAYGYVRTRRLWLPIGIHIGWNLFEGTVFGFQVSGLSDIPRLILQHVQGPELLTGGAFGPEAGLIVLPAMLIGAILIRIYTQQPS